MSGTIHSNTALSRPVVDSRLIGDLRKIDKLTGSDVSLEGLAPRELNRKVSEMKKMPLKDRVVFLRQLDTLARKGDVNALRAQLDILHSKTLSKVAGEACGRMVEEAFTASRHRGLHAGRALGLSDFILHLGRRKGANEGMIAEVRKLAEISIAQLKKEIRATTERDMTEPKARDQLISRMEVAKFNLERQLQAMQDTSAPDIRKRLEDGVTGKEKTPEDGKLPGDAGTLGKGLRTGKTKRQTDTRKSSERLGFFARVRNRLASLRFPSFTLPSLPFFSSDSEKRLERKKFTAEQDFRSVRSESQERSVSGSDFILRPDIEESVFTDDEEESIVTDNMNMHEKPILRENRESSLVPDDEVDLYLP